VRARFRATSSRFDLYMTDSTNYHLSELELINNLADPRRSVPAVEKPGAVILDVGCGIGQTLTAVEFSEAAERHGIDPDAEAIRTGSEMFPQFVLKVGTAEHIPYPADKFDLTFSRVAIPYTNIPRALGEIYRVTKPGGRIWLTLHDLAMERVQIGNALRDRNPKRLVDRCYVLVNSALLNTSGLCFRRPGAGTIESIQTESGIARLARKAGFADIRIQHGMHFLVTATKPVDRPA